MVTHLCDNPSCCNPDHLKLGDVKSNNRERVERGRSKNGENNGQSKLNEHKVLAIRRYEGTVASIARFLSLSNSQTQRVKRNEQWLHVTDTGQPLPKWLDDFVKNPVKVKRSSKQYPCNLK